MMARESTREKIRQILGYTSVTTIKKPSWDTEENEWTQFDRAYGRHRVTVSYKSTDQMQLISFSKGVAESSYVNAGLRSKLDRVIRYFKRKTAAVLNDEDALQLLSELHESKLIEKKDIDPSKHCFPLSKLAAANLCEIGSNIVYITPNGKRLIDSIDNA